VSQTRPSTGRTEWHVRVAPLILVWLLAAIAAGVASLARDVPAWLLVHLLLLGAVSNAILIWSAHFAAAMLRLPDGATYRDQALRLSCFNLGACVVVVGMSFEQWWAVGLGAVLVAIAVGWHAWALWRRMQRALPSRFGVTVAYYVSAAALLPIGVAIGVAMAPDRLPEDEHARFALAHVGINVLGWIGLTLVGTLITLWPTMLHTQVADGTVKAARRTLPILLAGVAVIASGALLDERLLATAGVVLYLVGLVVIGIPLAHSLQWRTQYRYGPASVLAAVLWLVSCVAALGVILAASDGWEQAADRTDLLAAPLLVGFAAQLIIGALSFLIPVVLGGGPAMARRTNEILDSWGGPRLLLINAGVLMALLPAGSVLQMVAAVTTLAVFATFLVLAVRAIATARRRAR
jgi:nitrite reductase (NO-forming)